MIVGLFPHISLRSSVQVSVMTASLGLVGGIALQLTKENLILAVPLLIALPALNTMACDYATLINAHIADPESTIVDKKKLKMALIISVPLSTIGVILVSLFLAGRQNYPIDNDFILKYSAFVFASFALVIGSTLSASTIMNRILIRHSINSDDILIPLSNVLASVLMLLCVSFAAWRLF